MTTPNLIPYLRQAPHGLVLRHPLHFDLAFDSLIDNCPRLETGEDRFREAFAWKRDALRRAYAERDWNSWIHIHERYARPTALWGVMQDEAIKPAEWESLVLSVWNDHEYASGEQLWLDIFAAIPNQRRLMTDEELVVLDALPDPVTAWRGLSVPEEDADWIEDGWNWSWSLDRSKAEWFARRHVRDGWVPVLIEADIPRERIIAYHDGRGEQELICKPDLLFADTAYTADVLAIEPETSHA